MNGPAERRDGQRLPEADWPTPQSALRHVLDTLPDAAYVCDVAGHITYFNPLARELWGREPTLNDPRDRFCGSWRMYSREGTPIPHSECWMALALRHGVAYDARELVIERPDGVRRQALAHVRPLHDEGGRLVGALNIVWDITERALAEHLVREADRRRDDFLATLAHELRNPLAPLRAGVSIIRMAGADPTTVDEHCSLMDRQLQQLARLVDDLLDVTDLRERTLQLHRTRVDLRVLVRVAVEQAREIVEAADHRLHVALAESPVFVDADPQRLGQVLSNLLSNAVKYTPRGGRIDVVATAEAGRARVTIRDNGLGIAGDKLEAIFEMFGQVDRSIETGYRGLGLGLNLVRQLVAMHGGTVEAESAGLGTGSVFTVSLPATSAPDAALSWGAPAPLADAATRGCRVLLVDDNRDVARAMARLVRLLGHEVHVAFDGREAVALAGECRPDVVLMDIGLPVLNGYEAAREIRSHAWGVAPVLVAMTGWGRATDRRLSQEAGFNHHLTKPVEPRELESILNACRPDAQASAF